MATISLPMLTYSIEFNQVIEFTYSIIFALSLNATELLKLDHPWCRTFMKIFSTFDNTVIKQCQYFTSVLPIGYYYIIRKVTFIKNLLFTNNVVILTLYNTVAKSEISTCAAKFKCEEQNFNWKYRSIVSG